MPTSESENDADRPGGEEDATLIVRRVVIPRKLHGISLLKIFARSGPGLLLGRLATEDMLGAETNDPLTGEDLASLVLLFQDEPLPQSLRDILIRELRGERRARRGPKVKISAQSIVELAMLVDSYKDACVEASEQRRRLVEAARSKPRRARAERVPPISELAAALIREWLPTLGHLSDKAIANKVSELKGAMGK